MCELTARCATSHAVSLNPLGGRNSSRAMHTRRMWLGAVALVALVAVGCRHDWRHADDFASEVRCGMSLGQVEEIARKNGVHPETSTYKWPGGVIVTIKPFELDFVDLWFQDGRLVAVQRGNYVAFSTGMHYEPTRALCGQRLPPSTRFERIGEQHNSGAGADFRP
jgi:hypothetical protein